MRTFSKILIVAMILIVSTGCSNKVAYTGSKYPGEISGTFSKFDGQDIVKERFEIGEIVEISCEVDLKKGTISLEVRQNEKVITSCDKNETIEFEVDNEDKYEFVVIADDAKGSYKFEW